MAKIGDLLPQLIVRYGLHRRRNLEPIEEAWRQAISEKYGEKHAAVMQMTKLHRGTLTIKVPHNAYMHELSFGLDELVKRINALLADGGLADAVQTNERIKRIRFEV